MLLEDFFYMHMCTCTGNKGNKLWFEVGLKDGGGVEKDQYVSYSVSILSQIGGGYFQVISSGFCGD